MTDVTRILSAIEQGEPQAAERLLPLVYDELRKLAAHRLSQEKPGQTLQATALVHEAYVRQVDQDQAQRWDGRGHFFAAAAEAMRRILVKAARHKARQKRGGGLPRVFEIFRQPRPQTSHGLNFMPRIRRLSVLGESSSRIIIRSIAVAEASMSPSAVLYSEQRVDIISLETKKLLHGRS